MPMYPDPMPARQDADGNPNPLFPFGYCSMNGHRELGCGTYAEHMALVREGVGFSSVPGPDDRELEAETRADRELMLDEFGGYAPGELTEMYGR